MALVRYQVVPDQSKARFRVREQLARLQLPSEAVGTTGRVTGQLTLTADGIASDQSKITVNVNDLRTDDQLRDGFIKRTTLETQRFPNAEFVPTRLEGLPSPLPDAGEQTFRLIGQLTIHGVTKETAWDVTARRDARRLTGIASTTFKFGDFGMSPPQAPVVLSVVDEIRVEIDLVATQAG